VKIVLTAVCVHHREVSDWTYRSEFVIGITTALLPRWESMCLEDEFFILVELMSVFMQLGWLRECHEAVATLELIDRTLLTDYDAIEAPTLTLAALDLCLSMVIAGIHVPLWSDIDVFGVWGLFVERGGLPAAGIANRHERFLSAITSIHGSDPRTEALAGLINSWTQIPRNPSLADVASEFADVLALIPVQILPP
jgi:hypothetical protein